MLDHGSVCWNACYPVWTSVSITKVTVSLSFTPKLKYFLSTVCFQQFGASFRVTKIFLTFLLDMRVNSEAILGHYCFKMAFHPSKLVLPCLFQYRVRSYFSSLTKHWDSKPPVPESLISYSRTRWILQMRATKITCFWILSDSPPPCTLT